MKLLLVEDNPADVEGVRRMLAGGGMALVQATGIEAALDALAGQSFDALLLGMDAGAERDLTQVLGASGAPLVALIAGEDERLGALAVQAGAQDYLVKGRFDGDLLQRTLRHALERHSLLHSLARETAQRKKAQAALEQAGDAPANRALGVLSRSNRTLLRARDEQYLLDEICRLAVEDGGYLMAWVGYARHDPDKTLQPVASAGEDVSCVQILRYSWADDEWGRGPFGTAVRTGRIALERDVAGSESFAPWCAAVQKRGVQSVLALPLRVENQVIGMLSICSRLSAAFEGDELELLEELAADLSFGIETLRARAARQQAEAKARLLSSAIEQTADLVTIADRDGTILYVNAAFEQVTGYAFDEAVGRTPAILKSGIQSPEVYEYLWRTLRSGQVFHGTLINRRKDGSLYYEQKTITPIIKDEHGEITHFLSTGKDITNEVAVENRLRQLLLHDPLTELPNRGHLRDKLERLFERAESDGKGAAVLVLNLDRFKIVNHSLGHEGGDALLQATARRLAGIVRPGDMVARLEADNFAVLMADIHTVEDVSLAAGKLMDGFSEPFVISGEEIFVTASMGVSVWPGDGNSAAELLQNAEVALNRAKQRGRARCEYYEPSMNVQAVERLSIETSLRRALDRREFVLHYQPKVDMESGRIVGVEALLRWQHPERGLVPPGDFIPLLEETGLIVPVGRWVLETACAQHRDWAVRGFDFLVMAVNLSAQQFVQDDLVQMMEDSLTACGVEGDADWLELEITESAVMHDVEHTARTLQQLKNLGIRVAIDDFGTGHSSLSYLTRLPIDVLKVDRSFVIPLPHSQQDGEVVRAIIALARSLGLEVVAEGVEALEQHDFLLEQGCTLAQGYYFARPLPAEQVIPLLRRPVMPAGNA